MGKVQQTPRTEAEKAFVREEFPDRPILPTTDTSRWWMVRPWERPSSDVLAERVQDVAELYADSTQSGLLLTHPSSHS